MCVLVQQPMGKMNDLFLEQIKIVSNELLLICSIETEWTKQKS